MIVLKLADGSTLHDVRDNNRQVIGYISDAKNAVGTLDFDIYPKHPAYNAIKAGSTKIRAYRDGMWTHDYTVESVTNDLQLKKHVTATDELQYLERIEVPSYKTGVDGVPQTVSGFSMWLIEYYNARSGGERFAFGQIEGDIIDPTTTLDRSSDSPATVASIVKDKIIDSLGGYVRVRRVDGVLTIDLKADAAGVCHQYIEFGENLVDYADEQDASELYTAITADSTYKDDNGDEVTITLADAPDGDYLTGYVKQGDTVTNTVAAAAYGVRRKHLSFDDVKNVYTLIDNCEKYIAAHCEPVTTVNVSAADLSTLDSNVQSFDVGLYTRVKAAPMGFDAAFECQGAKRSLNDPTEDKYTLGWTWGSLSSINNRKIVETALGIGKLEQATTEIDQAAKDAAQQAQTAQDVASAANINATDAVTKADSAKEEATSASDTAQRAEASSTEAKQTATEANGVAQDASETASTAAITAAQASATAADAKSTADAKRRVFYSQPVPPYDKGDLWSQGTSGDMLICETPKTDGMSFIASDFVKASKYTDDTKAEQAQGAAETAQSTANNATSLANDAQIAADTAQGGVDALVPRVTSAETSIAQNSDEIALRATKTEAQGYASTALDDAKTYSDAQIKVQADRITSSAAATDALGARVSTVEQTASGLSVSLESVEATANSASAAANAARTEAASAAKTASDYMQYTADGLEVGNKSSGSWSGFRSRMAAGAFEVIDAAGNVLSSFGASVVELGKNSVNSIIKLCGGKGEVSYGTIDIYGSYYGALRIASEDIVNVEGSELVCRGDRVHVGNVKSTPSDPAQYCGLQVTPNGSAIVSGYAATVGSATKVYLSSDKNLPVQINGNDMVDFVVAQGNSGIWRWRKWASGLAECYGVTTSPVSTGTDNWHWLGYDTTLRGGHALPFSFTSVADATVTIEDPSGGAFFAGVKDITATKAPTFYVLSAQGYSRKVWIHYSVKGTWK